MERAATCPQGTAYQATGQVASALPPSGRLVVWRVGWRARVVERLESGRGQGGSK